MLRANPRRREGERWGSRLTQCGSTERHDTVVREGSRLKLHVFIAGLHLHSSLTETKETKMDDVREITALLQMRFTHYSCLSINTVT